MRPQLNTHFSFKYLIFGVLVPIGMVLPSLQINFIQALRGHLDQYHQTMIPIVLGVMFLILILKVREIVVPIALTDIMVYVLFLFLLVAHMVNLRLGSSSVLFADYMLFLPFYIIGYNIVLNARFKRDVLTACIVSILLYFAVMALMPGSAFNKIIGVGRSINEYRNLMPVIIYASAFFLFDRKQPEFRNLHTATMALATCFVLMSWSRTGLAFLVFAICLMVLVRDYRAITKFAFLSFGLLFLLMLEFIIPLLADHSEAFFILNRVFHTGSDGDSKRIELLLEGLRIMSTKPIFGNGFVADMLIDQGDGLMRLGTFAPHNQFVDIGIKTGVFGFFWFIFLCLFNTYRFMRSEIDFVRNFGVVWLGVLLGCFAQNFLFNFSGYFIWMLVGICARALRDRREQIA